MLYLLLLAASPVPAPVCVQLDSQFHATEKDWAYWSDFRSEAIKYNREQAAAVGGRWVKDVEDEKQKKRKDDADYAEKTDRILTLMLAHKCAPPDHVASPFNHQEKDQSSE